MTDETKTDPHPREPVHFEHWCEHPGCSKWGSLGYDIGKAEMRWYCFEHRWEEYPKPKGGATF